MQINKITITYSDYVNLGYELIPEEKFARYMDMALKTAERFTRNVAKVSLVAGLSDISESSEVSEILNDNRRGLCEIADIIYAEQNQLNRPISGFANEGYREQYFKDNNLNANQKILEIMSIYFTREQLYRGV